MLTLAAATLSLLFAYLPNRFAWNMFDDNCRDAEDFQWWCHWKIWALQWPEIAGYLMGMLLFLGHFMLFIRACVDCARYNKQKNMLMPLWEEVKLEARDRDRESGHF